MMSRDNTSIINHDFNWQSFKKGDSKAFELIYRFYANKLFNYGSKFCKDSDIVKEAVQELFVNLWTNKNNISDPASIKNYLFKALRLSLFKKISYDQKYSSHTESEQYDFQTVFNKEDEIIRIETNSLLQQRLQIVLDSLTAHQREVVFLKYYEELSYQEIAEIMGISVKAAYKLMGRAVDSIRSSIDKRDIYLIFMLLKNKSLKISYI